MCVVGLKAMQLWMFKMSPEVRMVNRKVRCDPRKVREASYDVGTYVSMQHNVWSTDADAAANLLPILLLGVLMMTS